ncbi:MAG: aspartate/glutamate racemase family protein [Vicinamibacteria bacterium]|nr:aspartate/glutamate racemase family protein [Vicinamibacteria bacterium]
MNDELTIAVTDSGLGGLSVVADLAARLPASGIAREARVVFVNALFDDALWYNDLPSEAEKARVFDAALAATERRYRPDRILIACNTLSVFYDRTQHARQATTPAVSIIPIGVALIEQALREAPDATAILLATKGTIDSGAHRRELARHGVPEERIVGQACPRLSTAIEHDPRGAETAARIRAFVAEAVAQLPGGATRLIASLNCTHFGYAGPLWARAFAELGFPGVRVLDPNPRMTDVVLDACGPRRFAKTRTRVEIVSKTELPADVRASLGNLLRGTSQATADALAHYERVPDLFHVDIAR